ncbi:MAG: hypothetical protein ACLPND_07380, partial [Candidatus Korobacteraceae bacterium]
AIVSVLASAIPHIPPQVIITNYQPSSSQPELAPYHHQLAPVAFSQLEVLCSLICLLGSQ